MWITTPTEDLLMDIFDRKAQEVTQAQQLLARKKAELKLLGKTIDLIMSDGELTLCS